jgi:hypothetical protein
MVTNGFDFSSISRAIETQAMASSRYPLLNESSKNAMITSPINLSIVPPPRIAIFDISVK